MHRCTKDRQLVKFRETFGLRLVGLGFTNSDPSGLVSCYLKPVTNTSMYTHFQHTQACTHARTHTPLPAPPTFCRGIPSRDPSSSNVMLLYSLLAERMLCSMMARSRMVQPSPMTAFWCGRRRAANSFTSGGLMMRSKCLRDDRARKNVK